MSKAVPNPAMKPDGTWGGGRRGRGERLDQLEAENAALRARLEMTATRSLTDWEEFSTPHLRAEMAARALYQEWGDPGRAMKLLGFSNEEARDKKIQERVLKIPEVVEILDSIMQAPKEVKKEIIQRCISNARLGTDDTSIRATAQLAKLVGWIKPDTTNVTVQTLVGMMNPGLKQEKRVDELKSDDVLSILSHEPGAPVRINTGDKAVEAVLAERDE